MRPHRGTWEPLLPPTSRNAVVGLVPLEPIIRGLDYLLPDGDPPSRTLDVVEQAMPIQWWGVLCLLAGVIALAGFHARRRRTCITGLWLGAAVYASLAAGQWWEVLGHPWFDGIRGPTIVTIFGLAQAGIAIGYARQAPGGGR